MVMIVKGPDAATPNKPDAAEQLLLTQAAALDSAPDAAAQAGEQAQERAQEAQAAQVVQSAAVEVLAGLTMARAMLLPMLPERKARKLAEVWRDEVLKGTAEAGAAVLQLHGLTLGGVMSRYGPYIALVGALAGPLMETRSILAEPEPEPVQEAGHGGE